MDIKMWENKAFVWYMCNTPANGKEILKQSIAEDKISTNTLKALQTSLKQCHMHPCLKRLLRRGLKCAKKYPEHEKSRWLINELSSGMDYANMYDIGKLESCHKSLLKNSKLEQENISDFFQNILKTMKPSWFLLRSLSVDIFCSSAILQETFKNGIVYGGMKHTETVRDCLKHLGWTSCHHSKDMDDIIQMCQKDMKLIESITNGEKNVLLLGEYHDKTTMKFASNFIECMNQRCNITDKDGVENALFIERHVKEQNEPSIPEMLACNRKNDTALQQIRCTDFIQEKDKCSTLKIIHIDVRHKDMGFLRYELLETRELDKKMEELCTKFEEKAKNHMIRYLSRFNTTPVSL